MDISLLTSKNNIYKYHIVCLGIIALLTIGFLFVYEVFSYNQKENAQAINIAGRQRMLSEQIALYANRHATESNAPQKDSAHQKLKEAVTLFGTAHQDLLAENHNSKLGHIIRHVAYDIYYTPPENLDAQVKEYVAAANIILNNKTNEREKEKALSDINRVIDGPLISSLDTVVTRIVDYDQTQAEMLSWSERIFSSLILLLILLESTLLFRPVLNYLKEAHKTGSEGDESLKFLEMVGNTIPDLVFIKDRNFKIVAANTAFINLYPPKKRDKIIGYTTFEEFLPDEAEGFLENDKKAFEIGESATDETLTTDGSAPRTFFTKKVRFNKNGKDYILGISRDITALKDAQSALKRSETQFRKTVQNSPVGMATVGLDGKWLSINKAISNMLGYDEDTLLTMNFQSITHPEDLDIDLQNLKDLIDGKIDNYHIEKRYIHKNGFIIWALLSVSMVRDPVPENSFFISQILDITEQKNLQRDLLDANTELEEFAYRTSHDLRSPLASAMGILGLAKTSAEAGNAQETIERLAYVEKGLIQLESLVKDILVLTQNKNQGEDLSEIDIEAMTSSALDKLRYMDHFERPEITINNEGVGPFKAQKAKISSIIENMISNAIKYQDPKKEKSFVKITAKKNHNLLVYSVEDNGLGIPKEKQSKIFQMFERFHTRVSFGSGLGLYILKKGTEKLGGSVSYQDTGDGSIFMVKIPVVYLE